MDRIPIQLPPGLSASDHAEVLNRVKDDSAIRDAHAETGRIQDQIDRLDDLMKLPMKERLRQVPEDRYDDMMRYMRNEFYHQKNNAFITLLAGGFAATAGVVAAAATGMIPSIAGTALGSLMPAVSFGGGLMYLKALKKWILPRMGDNHLKAGFRAEKKELLEQKNASETRENAALQKALQKALNEVKISADTKAQVAEERDFIEIDGMRLKRRPEPGRDCLQFINDNL